MVGCDFSEHFAKADNKARYVDAKALCLQTDQSVFEGSQTSSGGALGFLVFLTRCHQEGCKSEAEINEYLN